VTLGNNFPLIAFGQGWESLTRQEALLLADYTSFHDRLAYAVVLFGKMAAWAMLAQGRKTKILE
jgi:hypothetical protein